jgi:hypothetical protein
MCPAYPSGSLDKPNQTMKTNGRVEFYPLALKYTLASPCSFSINHLGYKSLYLKYSGPICTKFLRGAGRVPKLHVYQANHLLSILQFINVTL